jgi:hypothetical protein
MITAYPLRLARWLGPVSASLTARPRRLPARRKAPPFHQLLAFAALLLTLTFLTTSTAYAKKVVAWGANDQGQTNVPAGLDAIAVAAGGYHSLALKTDGRVAGWGYNAYGAASVPATLTGVVAIAAGGYHSLALKTNGQVVGWGYNGDGAAFPPTGLSGVVAIAAGGYHSLALKSDGTVVGWGYNGYGQTTPPAGLTGVKAISAGAYHSLALKNDGTVVAWGYNIYGQTTVPSGLTGVTAIAAGAYHSMALKSNQTVVAWGYDAQGAVSQPAGINSVAGIAANYHSLALKVDGGVAGWGNNQFGQATAPAAVDKISAISAGFFHTLALNVTIQPPIANAGVDRHVNEGAVVTLDGSASSDPNQPALTLKDPAWRQLSGPLVVLTNDRTFFPSFTAPSVPEAGAVLSFQFSVSNGAASSSDIVNINVDNVNNPPTANAGQAQTVFESTRVSLEGNGTDADGDPLTLTWTQVGGPAVALEGADTVNPSFDAPAVSAAQESIDLRFRLTVNDGKVNSGPSEVVIHVVNTNDPPVAMTNGDASVNEADAVIMDGAGSSDPNNDPLMYHWTQIGGPAVQLIDATTAKASFIAPEVAIGGATLTFKLTVSDGELDCACITNVRVNNVNHAPLADAGIDQTVPENEIVTLDGSNSADVDADSLTYAWEQIGGPTIELVDAATANPRFTAPDVDSDGATLTFRVSVDDGYGGTASDQVKVNVRYVNRAPVANAGADQNRNEGSIVTLEASGSDPDKNSLAFAWSQVDGPAVVLSDAAAPNPTFIAPAVTREGATISMRVVVSDLYGGSASDDVVVHINNVNHAPVAQAPANLSVAEGEKVTLIGTGTDEDVEEQNSLQYAWEQTAGPAVLLTGTGDGSVSFTAPLVAGIRDARATLTFKLTAKDPNGASGSDEIEVIVTNIDHAPLANAGGNLLVSEGASVTLNGSASADPDGDTLAFAWKQVSGPNVVLNDANTAWPSFTAPIVELAGATLRFQLTVSDGFNPPSSDIAAVAVTNVHALPDLSQVHPSVAVLWPPNHRMVPVSIVGIIDPSESTKITITSITQDEAACDSHGKRSARKHESKDDRGADDSKDKAEGGSGSDEPGEDNDKDADEIDAIINPDGTALLRAERAGNGDGRVYRISFTATNIEGTVAGVVKVFVPHSKKSMKAKDSGCAYASDGKENGTGEHEREKKARK